MAGEGNLSQAMGVTEATAAKILSSSDSTRAPMAGSFTYLGPYLLKVVCIDM